jgi:hypothetical protein
LNYKEVKVNLLPEGFDPTKSSRIGGAFIEIEEEYIYL